MREPRRIASQNSTKIRNFDEKYKTETAIGEDPKLNVKNRRNNKKIQRGFAVSQSTENVGNHIVKNSRTRTHKNHKHVAVGIF